jgi:PleD family two-component response regulator
MNPGEIRKTWTDKSRILIVDNNAQFADRVRLLLEATGHYIACAVNDPRRALEAACSFRPDLVLLDLIMPEADGTEVAAGNYIRLDAAQRADRFRHVADHSGRGARRASHQWTSYLGEAAHCRRGSARSRRKPAALCRGLTNQFV